MEFLSDDELEKIAAEEKCKLPNSSGKIPTLDRSFTAEEINGKNLMIEKKILIIKLA